MFIVQLDLLQNMCFIIALDMYGQNCKKTESGACVTKSHS